MRLLKLSLLSLVLVAAALAQTEAAAPTEAQVSSAEVERVGKHIQCQCGSCQENLNCNMSAHQCHFCKPARTKIFQMQQSGMNDDQIFASFVKDYGQKIFLADPNSSFWMVPYLAFGLGAIVVWFLVMRMRKPAMKVATAGGPHIADDDPELAHYRDRIEKETSHLE